VPEGECNAFAKTPKPYGQNLNEWLVCASLQCVAYQTLSELSAHLTSPISALSRIIDRVENQKLVKCKRSATDGRSIKVALTIKGSNWRCASFPLRGNIYTLSLVIKLKEIFEYFAPRCSSYATTPVRLMTLLD